MKTLTTLSLVGLLLVAPNVEAQIVNVPVSSVSLAAPGVTDMWISLGGTSRHILPTPFTLSGPLTPINYAAIPVWFCMDPLQTIFYNGSGQPYTLNNLVYGGTNPADYDKWDPSAPGLSNARQQMLADLFTAYPPQVNLMLNSPYGLVDQAVALQLAVAEIANELDVNLPLSLLGGSMQASPGGWNPGLSGAIITQAQTFLSSLTNQGIQGQGNIANLRFLIDGGYPNTPDNGGTPVQDLVGWSSSNIPGLTPVPESGHFVLGALGIAGLAAYRRMRGAKRGNGRR